MGTHCSSELNRGHISKSKTAIMKLLLLTVFVASAFATEEVADAAKPVAVAPVHAVHPYVYGHNPFFYGLLGHQQQWPSISAPGFSSQCFGCRGKRSAEAEADAEPGHYGYNGYYGHPFGYYGYPYLHPVAVESSYENDLPGDSSVSVKRTHFIGKRSAEADAEPGHYGYYGYPYGSYGYPYHFGYRAFAPIVGKPAGAGVHPGGATSFVARSPQGLGRK